MASSEITHYKTTRRSLAPADDPTQILEFLEPGAEVEKVGEESLLGAETTHYRAMVDVRELVAHAPAQVQKAVGAAGMLQEAPHFPSTSGSTTPA